MAFVGPICSSNSLIKDKEKGFVTGSSVNNVDNNSNSKANQSNNNNKSELHGNDNQIEPTNSDLMKNNDNYDENINNSGGVLIQSIDEHIDYDDIDDNNNELKLLSSDEQIVLLSKQLNALTQQRKEDYQLLENNLKKYVKKNLLSIVDEDVRKELEQLR